MVNAGDIVCFKRIHKIDLSDLIARKNYSKYMIVLEIINHVKPACKVMCANGELNWVAVSRLEKVK
jgi:hypothetical protein